jgi:hypothetical protein
MLSISKSRALLALEVLICDAVVKSQPAAVEIYAKAWKHIVGLSFPNQ